MSRESWVFAWWIFTANMVVAPSYRVSLSNRAKASALASGLADPARGPAQPIIDRFA